MNFYRNDTDVFHISSKSIGFLCLLLLGYNVPELVNGSINKPILTCRAEHSAACFVEA